MINGCELLINIVSCDKPKMLIGLNHKVRGRLPPSHMGYYERFCLTLLKRE
jgi:hypothetical protein